MDWLGPAQNYLNELAQRPAASSDYAAQLQRQRDIENLIYVALFLIAVAAIAALARRRRAIRAKAEQSALNGAANVVLWMREVSAKWRGIKRAVSDRADEKGRRPHPPFSNTK